MALGLVVVRRGPTMAAAAPAAASHLGAAAPETLADKLKKTEVKKPLTNVELEGHALLKIVQHCQEALPRLVTGQLLGLDVGQTLEITDCFPFPVCVCACALMSVVVIP